MNRQEFLLKTEKITKDFGEEKGAFEVVLEVKPGEIVGFLGPNGAGKTTTLSMLTGLSFPTSGNFEILGQKNDNPLNIYKINSNLGVMLSDAALENEQTAKQFFIRRSSFFGKKSLKKALDLAEKLELSLKTPFKKLSLGNKKKVGLIASEMHTPKLLILDEPTSGLDPLIQQKFLKILMEVKNRGGAVLLSSHVLTEVQQICDRVVIIKKGKIVKKDSIKNVLKTAFKKIKITGQQPELLSSLQKQGLVNSYQQNSTELVIFTQKRLEVMRELVHRNIS